LDKGQEEIGRVLFMLLVFNTKASAFAVISLPFSDFAGNKFICINPKEIFVNISPLNHNQAVFVCTELKIKQVKFIFFVLFNFEQTIFTNNFKSVKTKKHLKKSISVC